MKRRAFLHATPLATTAALGAALGGGGVTPARAEGNADNGTEPSGPFEVVAQFFGPGPSGIVVMPDGRTFVGFPRHAVNHPGATLGELKGGKVVPYPSADLSMPSGRAPADRLMSIHGMTRDSQGRLWAIDDGKLAGHSIPAGAAKIICIDPKTDQIVHKIVLKTPVMLPDSHMNDLRVTLKHGAQGTVFVTDSSFGTQPGLVIVDVATGRQRRVLTTHPSALPEEGFMAIIEGVPRRYIPHHPQMVSGGIDGIAITPDETRLFYAPLTSRKLYSLPVDLLADQDTPEEKLAEAVRYEGEKGTADGLCFDRHGRLYTTNYEHDCILRRDPDGSFELMVRDPRILSPDGICATDDYIYCTLGQWNRLASFNDKHDMRVPPYQLIRFPIEHPAGYNADPSGGQDL
ncbi:SMP-30/gluconolactonase/LRE family protein [Tanticharoenia sakaeratensis]|uniref:Gluconolactonase n=1 Tax=Tanticharoenia sakaeratensis NBRC 103193 TaxID=1231623 RepID=A0A0D6MLE5_9PROT|nr:L-dopachrome tautomerase-related protein [Tanticharoenia sakaeratensis]GAN54133.1 hypothetical protein Tasa_017_016 [Tanticharoenia sakaeratensis NBRC 103193]GBQ19493.1 gluconolactonase [Tanticharoenia sakaeratensis NBRC 103193]